MSDYEYPVFLFERGLALVNFVVFLSFYVQLPGLVLSHGLTPVAETMRKYATKMGNSSTYQKWKQYPTVFWFSTSAAFVKGVVCAGMVLSVVAFLGILPELCIPLCMILYNSCRLIGQPWLGLQMHATIVETDFMYTITAPFKTVNPFAMVFAARFLTWRIMLGCGACKYATGDRSWRDLTAMCKHYYTQPLPNPLSWYAHHWPLWFQKFGSVMTHVVEGPLTFLCFGDQVCRAIAFVAFFGLTMMINTTGNYGFLGLLTTVQSFSLLDDSLFEWLRETVPLGGFFFPPLLPTIAATSSLTSILATIVAWAVLLPYLAVSFVPLVSTFQGQIPWKIEFFNYFATTRFAPVNKFMDSAEGSLDALIDNLQTANFTRNRFYPIWYYLSRLYDDISPFSICNRYAKFGSMSTYRWELVFEASYDGENWTEIEFVYKPDNPYKRPAIRPLHLPGLDWRLWFLGPQLRRGGLESMPKWFFSFMDALIEGRKEVLDLLDNKNQVFHEKPPKYVRCVVYDYHFCEKSQIVNEAEESDSDDESLDEQGERTHKSLKVNEQRKSREKSQFLAKQQQPPRGGELRPWWTRDFIGVVCTKKARPKEVKAE